MITGQPISFCSLIVLDKEETSATGARTQRIYPQHNHFVLQVRLWTDEVAYPLESFGLAEDGHRRLDDEREKRAVNEQPVPIVYFVVDARSLGDIEFRVLNGTECRQMIICH